MRDKSLLGVDLLSARQIALVCQLVFALFTINAASADSFGSGQVSSIGTNAISGDIDGPSASARTSNPRTFTFDNNGDIYLITNSHLLKKITQNGNYISTITKVPGTGNAGPRGLEYKDGVLYIADTEDHVIRTYNIATGNFAILAGQANSSGNTGGDATTVAKFNRPHDIALGANGKVFVADYNNECIRLIENGEVSTYAGICGSSGNITGAALSAKFNKPAGLDINANGDLFVSDWNNHRIYKVHQTGIGLTVSLLAGSGSGDLDGDSSTAKFRNPRSVVVDANGEVFVADNNNHKIKHIAPSGDVDTIAGQDESGFVDGSIADSYFYNPFDIEIYDGDLYVADYNNYTIRKIEFGASASTTEVSTVAGRNRQSSTDGSLGRNALRNPKHMVKDSGGNVFIADCSNHRIRKLDTAGELTTFAGGSKGDVDDTGAAAKFNCPWGIAVDGSDNLYVSDLNNNKIKKITSSAVVTTFAGSSSGFANGLSTAAKFKRPRGLSFDASGNLYVADSSNNRIRMIQTNGSVSTIIGGSRGFIDGFSDIARLNNPNDVEVLDDGSILVADTNNHAIRKIEMLDGEYYLTTISGNYGFGYTDGAVATAQFNSPTDIVTLDSDRTLVVDRYNHVLRAIYNEKVYTFAGSGIKGYKDSSLLDSAFLNPTGLMVLNSTTLLVSDTFRVRKLDISNANLTQKSNEGRANFIGDDYFVSTIAGDIGAGFKDGHVSFSRFNWPHDIHYDNSSKSVLVADTNNRRVREIHSNDTVSTLAGDGVRATRDGADYRTRFHTIVGIAQDSSGNLYLADTGSDKIRKVTGSGTSSTFAGSSSGFANDANKTNAKFKDPHGLTTIGSDVYVADSGNHIIRALTFSGVSTFAGVAKKSGFIDGDTDIARFNFPTDVAYNSVDGALYVADRNNHAIRKIKNGKVTTVAGTGTPGYKDGNGTEAMFWSPRKLAIDSLGDIYVADTNNNRIRKIEYETGKVSTFAGNGLRGAVDTNAKDAAFANPYSVEIKSDDEILVADAGSGAIRLISLEDKSEDAQSGAGSSSNSRPIVLIMNDLDLDDDGSLEHTAGRSLVLQAFAYDNEDGTAVVNSVRWISDLDGVVGTGKDFDLSALNEGEHNLVIRVRDRTGRTNATSLKVKVIAATNTVDVNSSGSVIVSIGVPKVSRAVIKRRLGKRVKFKAKVLDTSRGNPKGSVELAKQVQWSTEELGVIKTGRFLNINTRRLGVGTHNLTATLGANTATVIIEVR